MTTLLADLEAHWTPIAPFFSIRNEDEYDAAVARINALLDEVGTNEAHPLYSLLDTLATLVHTYEAEHHAIPKASGPDVLKFLMEEHGVSATELSEIGSPEIIDRYLAGSEDLSLEQVRILSSRFQVSPAAFI